MKRTFEVFINKPKTFQSKSGRDCYLSGISQENGVWKASIRYIDNGEIVSVNYELIKKYL